MTRLSLSTAAPIAAKADALVVGLHTGPDGPVSPFDQIAAAAAAIGATGKPGEVFTLPGGGLAAATRVVVVGLGDPHVLTGETVVAKPFTRTEILAAVELALGTGAAR